MPIAIWPMLRSSPKVAETVFFRCCLSTQIFCPDGLIPAQNPLFLDYWAESALAAAGNRIGLYRETRNSTRVERLSPL